MWIVHTQIASVACTPSWASCLLNVHMSMVYRMRHANANKASADAEYYLSYYYFFFFVRSFVRSFSFIHTVYYVAHGAKISHSLCLSIRVCVSVWVLSFVLGENISCSIETFASISFHCKLGKAFAFVDRILFFLFIPQHAYNGTLFDWSSHTERKRERKIEKFLFSSRWWIPLMHSPPPPPRIWCHCIRRHAIKHGINPILMGYNTFVLLSSSFFFCIPQKNEYIFFSFYLCMFLFPSQCTLNKIQFIEAERRGERI